MTSKTSTSLFHLKKKKKQEARVFASLPTEAMIAQTFRHISYSDSVCPTCLEIFTCALKQMCSDTKKLQKREGDMSAFPWWCWWIVAVSMDDRASFLSQYALIKTFSLMFSLSKHVCALPEIQPALRRKGVCLSSVSDPATISCLNTFHKHIQWNVLCAPSKLLAFIHPYWKRKTLLHVNKWIPWVFRAALVLYLNY